jgi:hypothetical protein
MMVTGIVSWRQPLLPLHSTARLPHTVATPTSTPAVPPPPAPPPSPHTPTQVAAALEEALAARAAAEKELKEAAARLREAQGAYRQQAEAAFGRRR